MTTAHPTHLEPAPGRWPAEPGTYLLVLRLAAATELAVGRLGTITLDAGWYVYVGSALGGLGPRIRRHLRAAKRRHWHVDYLLEVVAVVGVAYRVGPERLECEVAGRLSMLVGASRPVQRFGASDCRCRSHLVRFAERPGEPLGPDWTHVVLV